MTEPLLPPDIKDAPPENTEKLMTLVEHLTELRSRFLYVFLFFIAAFALIYPFSNHVLDVLMMPLAKAMRYTGGTRRMIFTGVAEGFLTHLKLAGFGGILLTFPFLAYQMWRFVAPGLYPNERQFLGPIFFASPVLFLIGALFVYYGLMPLAFRFLLSFQQLTTISANGLPVVLEARLAEYLSFLTTLILAFGISFQLPIVLVIMAKMGLITSQSLISARRYAIVMIFIVAAVLTPPDVISQIALAVPLLILYEGAIWCIQRLEKNRDQVYK